LDLGASASVAIVFGDSKFFHRGGRRERRGCAS
jgi:hypothetical protein